MKHFYFGVKSKKKDEEEEKKIQSRGCIGE